MPQCPIAGDADVSKGQTDMESKTLRKGGFNTRVKKTTVDTANLNDGG